VPAPDLGGGKADGLQVGEATAVVGDGLADMVVGVRVERGHEPGQGEAPIKTP